MYKAFIWKGEGYVATPSGRASTYNKKTGKWRPLVPLDPKLISALFKRNNGGVKELANSAELANAKNIVERDFINRGVVPVSKEMRQSKRRFSLFRRRKEL